MPSVEFNPNALLLSSTNPEGLIKFINSYLGGKFDLRQHKRFSMQFLLGAIQAQIDNKHSQTEVKLYRLLTLIKLFIQHTNFLHKAKKIKQKLNRSETFKELLSYILYALGAKDELKKSDKKTLTADINIAIASIDSYLTDLTLLIKSETISIVARLALAGKYMEILIE